MFDRFDEFDEVPHPDPWGIYLHGTIVTNEWNSFRFAMDPAIPDNTIYFTAS